MPTPIEHGFSLGPKSGAALRAAGVETLEQLTELGWEEALLRVVELDPRFINLNMAVGLMAAIDGVDWRTIGPERKARARVFLQKLRRELAR